MTKAPAMENSNRQFGWAWVALSLSLAFHVTDEAVTDFLAVYNPTVAVLRSRASWFPLPQFTFDSWITGLALLVILLLALSPFAFRGARWMRPLGYFLCVIMFANGLGHVLGTILGHTVPSVHFPRPMPGFYSSPLLLVSSAFLFYRLRKTAGVQIAP